ncbi:hypothetical protein TREPR_0016 [Treponema primitia ZAS-2]|uniref:Uncharacterized protein n=1 Tax=Treponema primitia (strain ATCC BAA-887 / DSM 12427 / ZAS-2) TaxID=545694 RepID=F5YNY8_TREPZ|nr:hypothetical protein TREPR_0016 [Treponema primitia ZAS-2]
MYDTSKNYKKNFIGNFDGWNYWMFIVIYSTGSIYDYQIHRKINSS